MPLPRVSLQALEAFERVAESGSVQTAASEMGLSISSVSHHVARLEEQLGVTLLNRASRPFALTREGQQTLNHLTQGLLHIRRATNETAISGLIGTRSLRLGIVEDFEGNVTPELAVALARRMPRAKLSIRNVLSHEVSLLLRNGDLDLAVASEIEDPSVRSEPLVRDPFILAVPEGSNIDTADYLTGKSDLPLLRFNQNHLIGKQIEGHLVRNKIDLLNRIAFDSVQSILAVVANGDGWSIITPLGFMRAKEFARNVRLHSLPLPNFARSINLMSRADFDDPTRQAIARLFRQIINREAVLPAGAIYPWLAELFTIPGSEN